MPYNFINLIHRGINPYHGFDHHHYPHDKQGNEEQIGPAVLKEVLKDAPANPTILEIGSWKGNSACYIAKYCKKQEITPEILCIDTFLGSDFEWGNKEGYYEKLNHVCGGPQVYTHFLANIIKDGHSDCITPFPIDSLSGAKLLYKNNVQADVICLDAAYDAKSAMDNLLAYWKLLKIGGTMFGTYFPGAWPEFAMAFQHFTDINCQSFRVINNQFILKKEANPTRVFCLHDLRGVERKIRMDKCLEVLGFCNIDYITDHPASELSPKKIGVHQLSITLKHLDAWTNILYDKDSFALILEDDAIFPYQFIHQLYTAKQIIRDQPKAVIFFNNFGHTTTVAYCLGHEAAHALITNFGDIDEVNVPVDHKIAEVINKAGLYDLYLWPPVSQTSLEPPPHMYLDYLDVCKMPSLV